MTQMTDTAGGAARPPSFQALILRLQTLCLGAPTPDRGPAPAAFALAPAWLHLALVLVFGLAMPGAMVAWLQTIAVSAQ